MMIEKRHPLLDISDDGGDVGPPPRVLREEEVLVPRNRWYRTVGDSEEQHYSLSYCLRCDRQHQYIKRSSSRLVWGLWYHLHTLSVYVIPTCLSPFTTVCLLGCITVLLEHANPGLVVRGQCWSLNSPCCLRWKVIMYGYTHTHTRCESVYHVLVCVSHSLTHTHTDVFLTNTRGCRNVGIVFYALVWGPYFLF